MKKREKEALKTIEKFAKKLPRFPDGRIDYSKSDTAPVVTVFVKYREKILLMKRSNRVRTYREKWNTVAGYLDNLGPIKEKILEELNEELKISKDNISSIHIGEPYRFTDIKAKKTWIVHPALVILKNKPKIKLDWEHTEYKWIRPEELKEFDTTPRLDESFEKAFK